MFVTKLGLASKHIENAQKRCDHGTEIYRNNEMVCAREEWAGAFFGGEEGGGGTEPRGADMGLLKRGWESGREGGRRSHFHLPGLHGIASERPPLSR